MEENRQKNSRRRLNSLILLVAFTAIMLIVSTYAWFSAQKNVSISNLEGIVKTVEGLEISLDASHWSQEVDLGAARTAGSGYLDADKTLEAPYTDGVNLVPTEMKPVSTTGITNEGIGKTTLQMYRGINVNGIDLYQIESIDETVTDVTSNRFPGYYAIDIFLKNTTSGPQASDQLQLNLNSELKLKTSGLEETGLQNTIRVAFALYKASAEDASKVDASGAAPAQSDVLTALAAAGKTIDDVAIWEPNADAHVDEIVLNNNRITWSGTDANTLWGSTSDTTHKFAKTDKIPTYALTATSKNSNESVKVDPKTSVNTASIANIYDWSDTTTSGLTKQVVQATNVTKGESGTITGGALTTVTDLISVTTTNMASPTNFVIPANQVCRLRMYVWLEGQDVDCTNLASHGGGIRLDLGLVKPGSDVS